MKSKNFLPLFILGQSFMFNGHALAQQDLTNKSSATSTDSADEIALQKDFKEANSTWGGALKQLQNASLMSTNRIVGYRPGDGFKSGINYGYGSIPTLGGGFLSVDRWGVDLGYLPTNGLGFGIEREVTFVQKHSNRRDSLTRKFYNPIKRVPLTAAKVDQMEEYTFVGFRAPVMYRLNAERMDEIKGKLNLGPGFSLFSTSEVDVQIYKMADNRVRVRLFAIKDKGLRGSITAKFIGLNLVTRAIVGVPLEIFLQKNTTDLFSVDYIFDMNNQEARTQYDQLLGQKYKISNIKAVREQLLAGLPNQGSNKLEDMFYSDLEEIQNIADSQMSKPANERSIIRLRKAKGETESHEQGITAWVTKLIGFSISRKDASTTVTMTNVENKESKYLIKTTAKKFSQDLFTLFGKENIAESGLLARTDDNKKPVEVLGFQMRRYNKDLNLKKEEFAALDSGLSANLPAAMRQSIKLPAWEGTNSVKNITIEHLLFFNLPVLEKIHTITKEAIRQELEAIISRSKSLGAEPQEWQNDELYGRQRYEAFQMKNYKKAYDKDWELTSIPTQLSIVLDTRYALEVRMGAFEQLQNIPLFAEVGPMLMLRLIPADLLEQAVNYRLSISGNANKDVGGERSNFPEDTAKQQYINVVSSAMAASTYSSDRSFNVRMFINEKGQSIGIQELINEAK